MNGKKWDKRFLELAKLVGSWSKDPSTQVGAVIVDDNKKLYLLVLTDSQRALKIIKKIG